MIRLGQAEDPSKRIFPSKMLINIRISFILISTFIATFVMCEADLDYRKFPRVKRVINGKPVLGLNSEYKSVQFFVLIAYGHSEQVRCGGSLLTSTITQTACHCIAIFLSPKDGYAEAQLKNVWEDSVKLYPGAVPLKNVKEVTAKKYIKHPNCKEGKSKRVYYDYGLIILSKSMRGNKDRFAPVYRISTLADLFVLTQAKTAVCLTVGYGNFRLMRNKRPDPAHPKELLHGWLRVASYLECYKLSYMPEPGLVDKKWNYTDDATWICAKNFTNHLQRQSFGDSGSPFVCNNQYVGVFSASDYHSYGKFSYNYSHSIAMSTAFTIFENSAEYRIDFIQVLQESDIPSMFKKRSDVFNFRPTASRMHQYHTFARSDRDHTFPNLVLVVTFVVVSILSHSYPTAVSFTL